MDSFSEKMLTAIQDNQLEEAEILLEQALQHDDEETLLLLGDNLFNIGFIIEAKQAFQKVLEKNPEKTEPLLFLAEIAIEEDDLDTAFAYLDDILPEDENYLHALMIQADIYQLLGISEVSEAKLLEAKQLLPREPVITFALAELYFSDQRYGDAITLYQNLLDQNILELKGLSLEERVGKAYSMIGDFEKALPYLEAALKKEETDDRLFEAAFVNIQLKEDQKATEYLQKLRELNPDYEALYLYLAELLSEQELIEEAFAVTQEGIRKNPYQVALYHLASELAYRLHDAKNAEDYLIAALELGDKTDETLLTLSNLYLNEARFDEVISTIEKMEEIDNPYASWNLAHAFNELEEFPEAKRFYDEAYLELDHEPEFLKEYGLFLREEGQIEKAQEVLEKYLSLEPEDLEIQTLLGEFY